MLAIKNNIMASNAARHLGMAYDSLAKSVERLASGLRINSAKDDAAGLAVRELIRADVAVLQQGARNAQDGISMVQTMEGAMAVMDTNLIRMKELAEQAATGSYSAAQRTIMDAEFAEMADEIERIAQATSFNDITMLDTAPTATNDVAIHVGTTTTIDIAQVDMTKSGLNIETGDGGWRLDALTANGVDATSDTWLTVAQGQSSAAATSLTLTISFEDNDTSANDELDIEVALSVSTSASTTFSLASIVSQINTASMDLGWDSSGNDLRYSAATAYLDTTSSKYILRLDSRETTSDDHSMILTGVYTVAGATGSVSGGFNITSAEASVAAAASLAVSDDMAAGATQAGLNILTVADATAALVTITSAINTKDTARAAFGYKMNRLESTVAILNIQAENLMAAESRISDVDVAIEMAVLTRTQVLAQAGVSMLAQANAMPQMALSLLR
ncbi:MAG: flagellin N-terminal helical domain-containing protein [Planctomycetota bacterium]|jgi:flagellin